MMNVIKEILVLSACVFIVEGSVVLTTPSNACVGSPLSMSCDVEPQTSQVKILHPDGTNAASCNIPLPTTVCSQISTYTTVPTVNGTVTTFVLSIPTVDKDKHNGNWTCQHGLTEESVAVVSVISPLADTGKEPTMTTDPSESKKDSNVTVSGHVYCQSSDVSTEILYSEKDGSYKVLELQPNSWSTSDLGSNGCDTGESNRTYTITISKSMEALKGKKVKFSVRFNLTACGTTFTANSTLEFTFSADTKQYNVLSIGVIVGIAFGIIAFGICICIPIILYIYSKACQKTCKIQSSDLNQGKYSDEKQRTGTGIAWPPENISSTGGIMKEKDQQQQHASEAKEETRQESLVPPDRIIKFKPGTVVVKSGKKINVTASSGGIPPPEFVWYKDVEEKSKTETLVIKEANEDDAGEYKVMVCNSEEACYGKIYVNVVTKEMKSREQGLLGDIKVTPTRVSIHEGDLIEIKAENDSYPIPKYTWTKDGNMIHKGQILMINSATLQDAGTYRVTAVCNKFWNKTEDVEVEVKRGLP